MPEFVLNIGFTISIIFTSSVCILIARRVFKSGIEHFSSRILVFSGIINTCLCALLFLSQGIYELIRISTSDSIHFSQLLIPIIFIGVPIRILWNYFSIQRKPVVQLNLQPCTNEGVNTEIATICKTMAITPPTIMSSSIINSPFVFGCRSSKAILAIPEQWLESNTSHQHVQLLHELSHIRNHDVGFLAWSNASLRDLRFLTLLLPTLIIYCLAFGYNHIAPSISLYLACSLILFVMLRYVIRKRESLADMTAAMLVRSGKVKDVITSQEIYTDTPDRNSIQKTKPKLADIIQRWLSDKAMFSRSKKSWELLLQGFNFFNSLHPSRSERIKKLTPDVTNNSPKLPILDSFWAGVAMGLMGVVIGLGGFWFSVSFQYYPEEKDYLSFAFKTLGIISPIAIGYLAIFLALPVCSSLKLPSVDNRFILSLMGRYVLALAGASVISPILLTAGATNTQKLVLITTCLLWYIFIAGFSFGINVLFMSQWISVRYLQTSHLAELRKGICKFSLFIIAILSLVITGSIMTSHDMVFSGANIVFSTVTGGVIVSRLVRGSRFSENEQYFILCLHIPIYRSEGKWFRCFAWVIESLYLTVLLFIFAPLIYLVIDLALGRFFPSLDSTLSLIIAILASIAVMVLLERNDLKMISESKRAKIKILFHCLKLLDIPNNPKNNTKIKEIIKSYDLKMNKSSSCISKLTMHDASEVVSFIMDDANQARILDHVSNWVIQCQTKGGFGIWPKSSSRLFSTYQAISILHDVNLLDKCNADQHTSWIKTSQQPDGSFKGPWSQRDAWQDTFHAIESLNILEASLDPVKANLCRNWCNGILIDKGLESDRPDIIYYCFAALSAIGKVDKNISKLVSDWLSTKIEELLLTNVSLDYENIHFAIMTYDLFGEHPNISSESISLLAERIQTALKAELADVRI